MKTLFKILWFILTHPLAGRHKFAALRRFFSYQISNIFNPYPIVFQWSDKTKLIVEKGMTGATGNIYCGLHEFEDMSFLFHLLNEKDLFVDIGANIGSYTIMASGYVGCKTIAFEPVPSTYERLKNNIIINHIGEKVEALNIGIGSSESCIRFTSNLDTINHVMLEGEESPAIEISVVSLDYILNGRSPTLIKIDVEGYETEVLKGARKTLSCENLLAIIIELNGSGKKYGYNEEEIHNLLINEGFQPIEYFPFDRKIKKKPGFGKFNTIYVRKMTFVQERLTKSSPYKMFGEEI